MPIQNIAIEKAKKLLEAMSINVDLISKSTLLDANSKEAILKHSKVMEDMLRSSLQKGKLTAAGLQSFTSTFLIYRNESINVDTELFWLRVKESNLEFSRKDPLRYALQKGRFFNVHQGMEARKNWASLMSSKLLEKRYTVKELKTLASIIQEDENNRAGLLRKCLLANKITNSNYLKFGDSMAYLTETSCMEKHFSKEEVFKFYEIWKNFK
jgi:hypothetical protein